MRLLHPGGYAVRYQPQQYKDPKLGELFYIILKKAGKSRGN